MRPRALPAALLAASLLALAPAPAALARTERTVGWAPAQVFPAAIRFLRVDEGATIVEKDAEAGYVLFSLPDDGKTYQGALELVALDDGRVRLAIRLDDRPDYMETGMLDRLERRLRDDLGRPPARKPPPKPEPPPPADDAPAP